MSPPNALQSQPQRTRTDSAGTSEGLGIGKAADDGEDPHWKLGLNSALPFLRSKSNHE